MRDRSCRPLHRRDQTFLDHIDGDLHGSARRALAATGLKHPKLPALDGELHILHVAVMGFQLLADREEFLKCLRHQLFHRRLVGAGCKTCRFSDGLGRADTGDDILALRVDEELAVKLFFTGGGVAGESNACRGGGAEIAEHHGLDVDCRSPVAGDIVQMAVGDGACVHPAGKDSADRAPELDFGILRKGFIQLVFDQFLVARYHMLPLVGGQFRIVFVAEAALLVLKDFLEDFMVKTHDDVGIHLDEAAIAIPCKTGVAGILAERLHRLVIETQIEDGIHHAGHGGTRTRANGDQEWARTCTEFAAGHHFHPGNAA